MLIPGMEYEIDIGVNQYRGTFKNRVDNLAYFDPLYVTKKYVPTPMMDWEKAVKALGITPEIAMKLSSMLVHVVLQEMEIVAF
jgi:hypothetical protein